MQIIVSERESYNGDKFLQICIEESQDSCKKRTQIFYKCFMTGWNRNEVNSKISERSYERCIESLFNKRVAEECLEDYDLVVRECAKIRMEYSNVYFKREHTKDK